MSHHVDNVPVLPYTWADNPTKRSGADVPNSSQPIPYDPNRLLLTGSTSCQTASGILFLVLVRDMQVYQRTPGFAKQINWFTISKSMENNRRYSSGLSGKSSLISETKQILQAVADTRSLNEARSLVVEDNILLKSTQGTRLALWEVIHRRYLVDKPASVVNGLAKLSKKLPTENEFDLILFYELALSLPIVYDLTTNCLYSLYQNGRSTINRSDILDWLDQAATNGHDEITGWSPQTKSKVASNYLTIARDFGLLEGRQHKAFARLYLPLPTFVYILYRLKDAGYNTKAIVSAEDFKLFLLEQRDVFLLMEEATRAGYVTFQQAGDIYSLTFNHKDLNEVIDELTR